MVPVFYLGFKENLDDLTRMGIDIPSEVEGECIIAQAQLFESVLADKAWEAASAEHPHMCAH